MTITEVVASLQKEKQNHLPSRFPCRAIMVKTIAQYYRLLAELKTIGDIRVIEAGELFTAADVFPRYDKLTDPSYHDTWVILTGVSEYLRLFSKKEASNQSFSKLWHSMVPQDSVGRILIPLWGCEAQWFDSALRLNSDERQEGFYVACTEEEEEEQSLALLVLSERFQTHASTLPQEHGTLFYGLREWFTHWENPDPTNTKFVLVTRQAHNFTPIRGAVDVRVVQDKLTFLREYLPGGRALSAENCSQEMQDTLFSYAIENTPLDHAILKILNVAAFDGVDVMGKWDAMSVGRRSFVRLWLQLHPDDSYLYHAFAVAEDTSDAAHAIAHEIFAVRLEKPHWVAEFRKLTSVMKIEYDSAYFEALDEIPSFETRLTFLTQTTAEARRYLLRMVGEWLRKDAAQVRDSEALKEVFPALARYLSHDHDAFRGWLGDYMARYKAHKLENRLPVDDALHFSGVDTSKFDYRYAVLSRYTEGDTFFLWVDALGVEWLPLLHWELSKISEATMQAVAIVQATLPSETCFNDQWKHMDMHHEKLDELDKLAHKGVIDAPDYYVCIEKQMAFMKTIAERAADLLTKYRRVVITGDHGTSRLAARFFHEREGIEAPKDARVYSLGRYCKLAEKPSLAMENVVFPKDPQEDTWYAVFSNYDHFKQSGCATRADDENALYGELHGGATPEEMLVPVFVLEGHKVVQLTGTWEKDTVKIVRKKATLSISLNQPIDTLAASIAGAQAEVSKKDAGKTWQVVFSGVKAGKYEAEVVANGRHILHLPTVTIKSALGDEDEFL